MKTYGMVYPYCFEDEGTALCVTAQHRFPNFVVLTRQSNNTQSMKSMHILW